jgi:integrase
MTIANLTSQFVAKITPGLYWDTTVKGFGLIVRPDGAGSWVIQYRVGKKQRKYKFADLAKLTAPQAREMAKDLFADITKGEDPQAKRKAVRQTVAVPTLTLRQALDKYIEMKEQEVDEGTYRDNSLKITKLYLLGEQYFGSLHKVSVDEITREAIAARLHDIRKARSDLTAGRARAQLRAAFSRLLQEGLIGIDANPCIDTKKQTERPERDRVLTDDELRAVWNACGMNTDFGKIVRLLILTGCRREEIGGLMWSEIDRDKGQINLPGERTKNGRPHSLTLPDMAMDIIRSVNEMHERVYLFGERAVGFRSWQVQKARFKDGISDEWKLHDIRRTVATGMAEIGIEPHIVEAVLNHQSGHKGGIKGVYNRAKYKSQMAIALAKWAAHVSELVGGAEHKVIAFPQSA